MKQLEFDEAKHEYTLKGQRLPSVTQVIHQAYPMSYQPDVWYLDRGKAIHKAIELHLSGSLDESTVDAEIKPFVAQFKMFMAAIGTYKVHGSEIRLCSKKYKYAGTADLVLVIDHRKWLIDVKTTSAPATVGMQTAAYQQALKEMGVPIAKRCSLVLKKDGHQLMEWNDRTDLMRFLKARNEYQEAA